MSYENERRVAIETVIRACRLCRSVRATLVTADSMAKKDKSPVTVADFGAQAVVSEDLAAAFPADPLVGEEHAADLAGDANTAIRTAVVRAVQGIALQLDEARILAAISRGAHSGGRAGRFWTLDPIDGTKGFLRGEQYAVALALIENGVPVLGVLGCPNLPFQGSGHQGDEKACLAPSRATGSSTSEEGGMAKRSAAMSASGLAAEPQIGCLFVAVKGQGAFTLALDAAALQELPICVSSVADAAAAVFCESVESGHSAHDDSAQVAKLLGVTAAPCRIDSQCKYAAVARGDASIYLRLPTRADYEEKIWDHAAGWMVVTEAGGAVTDVRGEPLDFAQGRTLRNNKGVVATNGRIHGPVVAAVRQVLSL